jgi:hypothetical protein
MTQFSLSDAALYDRLAGTHKIGVYPLLPDDTCHFLVVDFDEAEWRDDARVFIQSCDELGVPAALEISRSGNGAHTWIFFANRLIRLAEFQNPEFYKAQAMRFPVWDKPRVIGCELRDERFVGEPIDVAFTGTLWPDQKVAVTAMANHDNGVLCAPTAFGKTVIAAYNQSLEREGLPLVQWRTF